MADRSQNLDINAAERQPTHPVIEEKPSIPGPIGVVMHDEPKESDTDLLFRIHGLYRLLDLINEQGSGGAGMYTLHDTALLVFTLPSSIKWTRSSSLKSPWQSL